MPAELVILGTGGLAKETAQLARRIDPSAHRWGRIVYASHDPAALGRTLPYGDVGLHDDQLAEPGIGPDVAIGIGHPALRQSLAAGLSRHTHLCFPNLCHPGVEVDPDWVSLGQGNIVTTGVVMTCDIVVGHFNLLNWNVTVGHDCRIGSFNVINPGASISGGVVMGDACLVGTGARILEGLHIASGARIGAGAVVTRSISEAGTWVGVPARLVQREVQP